MATSLNSLKPAKRRLHKHSQLKHQHGLLAHADLPNSSVTHQVHLSSPSIGRIKKLQRNKETSLKVFYRMGLT